MKCENRHCGSFDGGWLYNCNNLALPGGKIIDCPNFRTCSAFDTLSRFLCVTCGQRYADEGSDYCRICENEMMPKPKTKQRDMKCGNIYCQFFHKGWPKCCRHQAKFQDVSSCPNSVLEQNMTEAVEADPETHMEEATPGPVLYDISDNDYDWRASGGRKIKDGIDRICIFCELRTAQVGSSFCSVCYQEKLEKERFQQSAAKPEPEPETAPKNNVQEGKAKMHLIPLDLLREFLVPAYEEGLIKYFEESWRLGFKASVCMDSIQRHLEEFHYKGEDLDQETLEKYGIEKTHLGAILFWVLGLCNTIQNHPELDDRVGKREES